MEEDEDYIDPGLLKARAVASGGAGAVSGRPRLHVPHGVTITAPSDVVVLDGSITVVGTRVETGRSLQITG